VELGLQHEQQHQELLVTDIKFILGVNARPALYDPQGRSALDLTAEHDGTCPPLDEWIDVAGGTIEVGHTGRGFAFDNESPRHTVLVGATQLRLALVTNQEYLDFMADGGYERHELWHAEGWDWVRTLSHKAPVLAPDGSGRWQHFTLGGVQPLERSTAPVSHVSYYEAFAFCQWPAGGCRQSSNGRQGCAPPGAAAGNGRKAPTSPTRGFAAVRVPSVNTTASSWSTSRCCVEPRSPRHRVMRA
jgi:formylglycine-generating enzyme required for sulfatase activity